jgi:DUF4097 and DUF4098 domain-containing protein YvlB
LLFAGSSLHASIIGIPQSEFRQTYSLSSTGRVAIQNLYGDVRITTWDRDEVLVQAIKKSRDPRQLKDAQIVVDSSNESVSIRTLYAGTDAEHPASVEYRITVPRNASLENVRLTNGALTISGVAGSIKASSVNGSIKAAGLEGQADLSTVNGQLEAEFDRVSRSNSISLSSVNGPIKLSIPSGSGAQLTAQNLSGGIESDFGQVSRATSGHKLRTTVNRGGAQIHVNNVNGGISIRSSWSRRSERPWS